MAHLVKYPNLDFNSGHERNLDVIKVIPNLADLVIKRKNLYIRHVSLKKKKNTGNNNTNIVEDSKVENKFPKVYYDC